MIHCNENESVKVWFVTGASQGFGLAIVKQLLLNKNYRIVAITRNTQSLKELCESSDGRMLALETDIKCTNSITQSVNKAVNRFGRIDVLVNNCGYGLIAAMEEQSNEELLSIFNVNLFSTFNTIKAILPIMRDQNSGLIYNISSMLGFSCVFGGNSAYSSTKYAMTGLSESLQLEVSQFNIKVVVVYPGEFKTNFWAPDNYKIANTCIDLYGSKKTEIEVKAKDNLPHKGDPDKFAKILVELSNEKSIPFSLFIGKDAIENAEKKIETLQKDLNFWRDINSNVLFDHNTSCK